MKRVGDHRKINKLVAVKTLLIVTLFQILTTISVSSQSNIYSFNFDNDTLTGWTFDAIGLNGDADKQCSWEIGQPSGGQGYNELIRRYEGNVDPSDDNTNDNTVNYVAGQGLAKKNKREGYAAYYNNSSEWIQSPELNFSDYYNVKLEYYRWANFEMGYDMAFIEVSADGISWSKVFCPVSLQDTKWVKQTLDISKYADRQSTFFIRWRSESDGSVFYSGWNIDDITISGKNNTNDITSSIVSGNIVGPKFISSTIDTYSEKITIGEFTISDAGSGDNLATIIDSLIITPGSNNSIEDWANAIKFIHISEVTTGEEKIGCIEKNRAYFKNSKFFTIEDGSSRTYSLSFYLKSNLSGANDNEQFEFIIDYSNIVVDPKGSFIGSGEMVTGDSKLILDIQATKLSFIVEPEQLVSVNRKLLPYIKVGATDENGNFDIDFNGSITLSNSGELSMLGNVESTLAGIATFSNCQFTEIGGPVILLTSHNGSSSISNTATSVSITVEDYISDVIYYSNFDNTGLSGWTSGAIYGKDSWETGNPHRGLGYSSLRESRGWVGNADPSVDHSSDNGINNVYGQGLGYSSKKEGVSGYYHNSEEWLMSPEIDLKNYYNTQLSFWRWANVEPFYDSAFVEISIDGNNWIDLSHSLFPADVSWTKVVYDISSIADRQSNVYIRWRLVSDGSIFYSGWNIDDVQITGIYSPVNNWLGTVSSNWNDAENWSTNSVPVRLSSVYINSNTPYRPIVNSTQECTEIIIKKDAILEVDFSGSLTVFGDVKIETDSKNYGSLIDRGELIIYGNSKVSRYLMSDEWHYISSPISNVNSDKFGNNIYYYDEVLASENWLNGWGLAENIVLEDVRGYDVRNTIDNIVNLEGDFNTGDFGITVTNTDGAEIADHEGWNLIGNPYPSAIDWDASSGWTKTNVNDAIYIWDESVQNYVTYIDGVGANGGSRYIPPMQGFFVRVPYPGNGYVGMTNDVRIANTESKLKSTGSATEGIKIKISSSAFSDETIVRFSGEASQNFDHNLDAIKKFSTNKAVPQIYSQTLKGELLAINSYPLDNEYSIIPVYITVASSGEYNLQFDGGWNIDYSQTIYLEDVENDSLIDLRLTNSYSFYAERKIDSKRFLLHVGMPLQIKYTLNNVSVFGAADGEIDLTIIGGIQPLTKVEWSNGIKSEDITGLTAGEYIVTITDAANNIFIDTIAIEQPQELVGVEINNATLNLDTESTMELKIFSVGSILHIISSDESIPVEMVEVFDISGKLVFQTKEQMFGSITIDLNNLKGIYLTRVRYKDLTETSTIILK